MPAVFVMTLTHIVSRCRYKDITVAFTDLLMPLVWVGRNTIFIFLMSPAGGIFESLFQWVYWGNPNNTVLSRSFSDLFCVDMHCPVNGTSHVDGCREWLLARSIPPGLRTAGSRARSSTATERDAAVTHARVEPPSPFSPSLASPLSHHTFSASGTCGSTCEWEVCDGGIVAGGTYSGAVTLFQICRITAWVGVAGVLHYRGWFWAL